MPTFELCFVRLRLKIALHYQHDGPLASVGMPHCVMSAYLHYWLYIGFDGSGYFGLSCACIWAVSGLVFIYSVVVQSDSNHVLQRTTQSFICYVDLTVLSGHELVYLKVTMVYLTRRDLQLLRFYDK